ncbi:hypothetical protein PISMIDRAFT_678278 [Pisolithus microcarpus 441]|uniref:Uncharacterized protein n=1 Tax=Pisolithus microcarpus 441 TaxID=765257 RepID=A0A0C9Z5L9_9AGAM|nr:hypothetical protein PISMIDRAFT_678278 [Pisolithus microcarpus 441]
MRNHDTHSIGNTELQARGHRFGPWNIAVSDAPASQNDDLSIPLIGLNRTPDRTK